MMNKIFSKKISENTKRKQTEQQANNMALFLGTKTFEETIVRKSECARQVEAFLAFFCETHKNELFVYRSDEDLFKEFYEWVMRKGRVAFGKQAFMYELQELQKNFPKSALPVKRELKLATIYESLLGKRMRED